jgi:hypothetical protein
MSRALGAMPLADPLKVRLVHEILRVSATGEGSRSPVARVLWDELGAYAGVCACPSSPEP